MKSFSRLILSIFLLLCMFTQCTIQKRLYNRGYHIEFARKFHGKESAEKQRSPDTTNSFPFVSADDLILKEEFPANRIENPKHIQDSIVYITTNKPARDTVYVQVMTKRELSKQKKQARLIGVGLPMLLLGIVAASFLSSATAAGASLSAILFLGAIGWLCAIIAAILLIIFLVFLAIPVAGDPATKTTSTNNSNLTSGEKTGLTITLVLIGILGLVFLISGLK